jgi:YbbR domain-containing protein
VDILAPMVFNPPEGVRVLGAENGTITISIREITKTQKYENVPVKIRNMPAGMTAEADPASISVTVTAGTGKMSKLLRAQVVPYVDVDGRGPGTYYLPVRFVLPDGFVEENFKSGTATVTVILRTK